MAARCSLVDLRVADVLYVFVGEPVLVFALSLLPAMTGVGSDCGG